MTIDHGLESVDLARTIKPVEKVQGQVHGQGVQLERHEEGEGGEKEVLQESPWVALKLFDLVKTTKPPEFGKLKHCGRWSTWLRIMTWK